MSDLTFLARLASPTLGKLDDHKAAGATWEWVHHDLIDEDGEPFDFTGCTITVEISDTQTGALILAMPGTPGIGGFTHGATAVQTAALAPGVALDEPRRCKWRCVISRDGVTVKLWDRTVSDFLIDPA